MRSEPYGDKLERHTARTLLPQLSGQEQDFIRSLAEIYRFTFQELRQVAQAARDLEMWREGTLQGWWARAAGSFGYTDRADKKRLLAYLRQHLRSLAGKEKVYPLDGLAQAPRRRLRLQPTATDGEILGRCPAYSEHTVCCGLRTLDAVRGCPYSCSYCTIQTFYGERAEIEADLPQRLASLEIDPGRRYHLGTGQASDSLVWGNRGKLLDALLDFANSHPNVLLELKTKSDNVATLLDRAVPANVVCSWTMNTETVIRNEEQGSASLPRRILAARRVADRGIAVGFHFHPMIFYQGWRSEYSQVADAVLQTLGASQVSFVSIGAVTLIKPVIQQIRRRGGETKILQMEMVKDHHGKLTYADGRKVELFRHLYRRFRPWHGEVFFYLCMENRSVWQRVLGLAYDDNADFEDDFLRHCLPATGPGGRRGQPQPPPLFTRAADGV